MKFTENCISNIIVLKLKKRQYFMAEKVIHSIEFK